MLETGRVVARGAGAVLLTGATVARLKLRRRACARSSGRAAQRWASGLLRALGVRIELEGAPPGRTGLLVANHRSYLDIPLLLAHHPAVFLAKAEVARWPLIGPAARLTHTVFVDRDCRQSRRAAREAARGTLAAGLSFAAFPEGTTSTGPGHLPFFPGLFDVAAAGSFPVTPVAISYSSPRDSWTDDDPLLRHFGERFREGVRARVVFGVPRSSLDARDLHAGVEEWIGTRLAELDREVPFARASDLAQPIDEVHPRPSRLLARRPLEAGSVPGG